MKVPFFDYPRHYLDQKENILKIIDDVCSRGAFIMQKDLADFEISLSKYVDCNYAVGVANATDGLEICWQSLGLKPGDEVIVSSHTMLATASSIKMAGGIPIPIDIGEDNLIDVSKIEESINEKTVGIMPTQLNGRTCDMNKIMSLAVTHDLVVIEDAAQALGSKYKDQFAGSFGKAAAFSFYPAKVLGCLGDGGAVVTNDRETYNSIFQLHDHGRDPSGEIKSWGRNSRLDNLNAAILDYNLKSYNKTIARRREIAGIYQSKLSGIEELKLPPGPNASKDHFDIYQNYELTAQRRDDLKQYLAEEGIGTLIQWGGKAIHQFKNLGFNQNLPKTEIFFNTCLMLPMNIFLSNDDVEYVCDTMIKFYNS